MSNEAKKNTDARPVVGKRGAVADAVVQIVSSGVSGAVGAVVTSKINGSGKNDGKK
nr:hypothetical protein [Pseudoxanthomonas sp.]